MNIIYIQIDLIQSNTKSLSNPLVLSIIRLRENSNSSSNFYQKLKNSIYH